MDAGFIGQDPRGAEPSREGIGAAGPTVTLTASAAKRIAAILSGEGPDARLRIGVDGGGCSGFQYTYTIVTEADDGDLVVEREGAVLLVDAMSLEYLRGSTVDFVSDLMGQAFKISNPQATASCGCGTSFAI